VKDFIAKTKTTELVQKLDSASVQTLKGWSENGTSVFVVYEAALGRTAKNPGGPVRHSAAQYKFYLHICEIKANETIQLEAGRPVGVICSKATETLRKLIETQRKTYHPGHRC